MARTYFSSPWAPRETPSAVRMLIIVTCTVAILSALTNGLFHFLNLMGPQEFLSLSWYGIRNFFLWQPITYMFVQDSSEGVQFFFLIALFFNMYILWVLGSTLQEYIGTTHFLTSYFGVGAIAGVLSVLTMPLVNQYAILTGPSAALLGVFVLWTMCYPDGILNLFFLIPLRTKWILAWVLAIIFLIALSQLNVLSMVFYAAATCTAYLYGVLALELRSPFPVMYPFEDKLLHLVQRLKGGSQAPKKGPKIVNLRGEPIQDDDEFVDAMLTKIAKDGERALTSAERKRMDEISEKKRRR